MNKRTITMIHDLARTKEQQELKVLAKKYDVSERTIRNDIKEINALLKENGLIPIEMKRGGSFFLPEDFSEILQYVTADDYYSYKLSKEERKMIAAAMLINSAGYITLATIADSLYVSRATIIADLDDIKTFIRNERLLVTSHPNKGLLVEGKESDKRWFLFRLSAFKLQDKGNESGYFTAASMDPAAENRSMISVMAGDATVIQKIMNEQEYAHQLYLSDNSFLKVLKYLRIMIARNLQGEYIEVQDTPSNSKYLFAQDILRYISQYCGIQTTADEIQYLSVLLDECRYIKKQNFDLMDIKVQMLTRRFIHSVSEDIGIRMENDYDFFENLSNHIQSMFASDASQFPSNPIVREIAEDHPEVAESVAAHLDIFQNFNGREITEIERNYIIVHVCAALERKKNSEYSFHVVVACHAGIGTSQLLMQKLKRNFNFRIVDIISAHEAGNVSPDQADFIISTVPLNNTMVDHVVVSPLLTDEDYLRVGSKIDVLRNSRNLPSRIEDKGVTTKGIMERITPILERHVPEQSEELTRLIRRTVRQYLNDESVEENDVLAPYLHQLLSPDHIQLDVECTDWRDAIRQSALPLLENGYIEERYIDAMIENVEENGPYIVLNKGFAMPHEGLEKGSVKIGMNLIRLRTPVDFGEEDLDPIEFVCCLSAVDHKTHLKAFFNLVGMLGNEEFRRDLHDAKTSREMTRIIERYEYGLE